MIEPQCFCTITLHALECRVVDQDGEQQRARERVEEDGKKREEKKYVARRLKKLIILAQQLRKFMSNSQRNAILINEVIELPGFCLYKILPKTIKRKYITHL